MVIWRDDKIDLRAKKKEEGGRHTWFGKEERIATATGVYGTAFSLQIDILEKEASAVKKGHCPCTFSPESVSFKTSARALAGTEGPGRSFSKKDWGVANEKLGKEALGGGKWAQMNQKRGSPSSDISGNQHRIAVGGGRGSGGHFRLFNDAGERLG